MRLGDIFFGLLMFTGGVVTGVMLRESNVVTGDQIKSTTKKVVDKFRDAGTVKTTDKQNE